jgi:ribosomal protein L33
MAKSTYVKVRLESEAGTGYRYYAKRRIQIEKEKIRPLGR